MILTNELLFFIQTIIICSFTLFFTIIGKEALIAFIGLLFVMANIFVIKQINLLQFTVTSADVFIIGISLSLNLLQEFWEKRLASKAVMISFALSLFYLIIAKCIIAYTPASIDTAQKSLVFILTNTTRIVGASFIAYLITQCIDIQLYAKLKTLTNGRYFIARNYFSLCFSQLIDTFLFSFLGLWGIVENIFDIILVSYIVKIFAIACMSPFLWITKQIITQYHQKN